MSITTSPSINAPCPGLSSLRFRSIWTEEFQQILEGKKERSADDELRLAMTSTLWSYAWTMTSTIGPEDIEALRGKTGADIIFGVKPRMVVAEMEFPTAEVEQQAVNRAREHPALRELMDFVEARTNSLAGAPLNDVITTLVAEGHLTQAKIVNRRKVGRNTLGQLLIDGVLIVREKTPVFTLLHLASEVGAHAICFVQTAGEGPNGVIDTHEEAQIDDDDKTPPDIRLSVLDFGTTQSLQSAIHIYSGARQQLVLDAQKGMLERVFGSFRSSRPEEKAEPFVRPAPTPRKSRTLIDPRLLRKEVDGKLMEDVRKQLMKPSHRDGHLASRFLAHICGDLDRVKVEALSYTRPSEPFGPSRFEKIEIPAEQKSLAASVSVLAQQLATALGCSELTFRINGGTTVYFSISCARLNIGGVTMKELRKILRLYLSILDAEQRVAKEATEHFLVERHHRAWDRDPYGMFSVAPDHRAALFQTALQDRIMGLDKGQSRLFHVIPYPAENLHDELIEARCALNPKELEQEVDRVIQLWVEIEDQFDYGESLSLKHRRGEVSIGRDYPSYSPEASLDRNGKKKAIEIAQLLSLPGTREMTLSPFDFRNGCSQSEPGDFIIHRTRGDVHARIALRKSLEALKTHNLCPNWVVEFADGRLVPVKANTPHEAALDSLGISAGVPGKASRISPLVRTVWRKKCIVEAIGPDGPKTDELREIWGTLGTIPLWDASPYCMAEWRKVPGLYTSCGVVKALPIDLGSAFRMRSRPKLKLISQAVDADPELLAIEIPLYVLNDMMEAGPVTPIPMKAMGVGSGAQQWVETKARSKQLVTSTLIIKPGSNDPVLAGKKDGDLIGTLIVFGLNRMLFCPGLPADLDWQIAEDEGGNELRLACRGQAIRSATTEDKKRIQTPSRDDILGWLLGRRSDAFVDIGDRPVCPK